MTLPEPNFIDRDPTTTEQGAIATFESALGKTLFPAQAERLMLNALVYRELLVRIGIQYAAQQNLVNYANGGNLDQLGELLNTPRIQPQAAQVQITFTRAGSTASSLLIPGGTRVSASGSSIRFALDADLTIQAGQASADGICTATTTGTNGNGFTVGQINTLIDNVPGVTVTVANSTVSTSGADTESDDRYRARIKLAPERFSVAGSEGAYKFHALSADSTIIDVGIVTSPPNLTVNVYPLTNAGLPTSTVITAVETALNADTVRPLTDIVSVQAPVEIAYNVTADIVLYDTADQSTLQSQLDAAAAAYGVAQAGGLGLDVVRSQIIAVLSLTGVYSVALSEPSADIIVTPEQWANLGTATINIIGTAQG